MNRHFAKKSFAIKRGASYWRRGMLAVALLSVCGVLGFGVYAYKQQPLWLNKIPVNIAQVKTWIAERKSHLHQGITKVKQLAAKQNEPPPEIHFEFYTALPDMQMKVATTLEGKALNTRKIAPINYEDRFAKAIRNENIQLVRASKTAHKNVLANKASKNKSPVVVASIVKPEDLERELSTQLEKHTR